MKASHFPINDNFAGRKAEKLRLTELEHYPEARILAVYGRRRVGKTELLEQCFRERKPLKFEGLENKPEDVQREHVLKQLADYCETPMIGQLSVNSWTELFKLIASQVNEGTWTVYFEEVQWLADYKDNFITELKYVWDNFFKRNKKLILILCGSSPAFMINHVVKSKALYNRSLFELPLKEFNLLEARSFMPQHSQQDVMDAILSVGGIPEYLQWLKQDSSTFLSLCRNAFRTGSPFFGETQRIFVSSLGEDSHYKNIIMHLAKNRFSTRSEIAKALNVSSGGTLTGLLKNLELCGFVGKLTPYHLKQSSSLVRYQINDPYLQFYFKFVEPLQDRIESGEFDKNPTKALPIDTYRKWLGFAFERFCRRYAYVIARIIGFQDIDYRYGPYFSRRAEEAVKGFKLTCCFNAKIA